MLPWLLETWWSVRIGEVPLEAGILDLKKLRVKKLKCHKKLRGGGLPEIPGSYNANLSPYETRLHYTEPGGAFALKNAPVTVWPKARVVGQNNDPIKSPSELGLIHESILSHSRQLKFDDVKNDPVKPQTDDVLEKSSDVTLNQKNPGDSKCHLLSNKSSTQETGTEVKVNLLGCHSQMYDALLSKAVPQDGGILIQIIHP